jgi:hypothetical protein
MQHVTDLKEFSKAEKYFLTGYLIAYFWDVTKSFKMVERSLAPNVTIHYAVPVSDSPLVTNQLDSLGDHALALRDDFKKTLATLGIRIQSAAIAVQFLGPIATLGIIDLENLPSVLQNNLDPGQEVKLEVYLPDSEPGAAPEDIGE